MSQLILPSGKTVMLASSIIPNGNFTWNEATRQGQRRPLTVVIENRIIAIASALEEVRKFLGGQPMRIHSWYRPPSINQSVGGARDSRHLYGDAVDFSISTITPRTVYKKLDNWWGARGGLGDSAVFTHIDLRGNDARWNYG